MSKIYRKRLVVECSGNLPNLTLRAVVYEVPPVVRSIGGLAPQRIPVPFPRGLYVIVQGKREKFRPSYYVAHHTLWVAIPEEFEFGENAEDFLQSGVALPLKHPYEGYLCNPLSFSELEKYLTDEELIEKSYEGISTASDSFLPGNFYRHLRPLTQLRTRPDWKARLYAAAAGEVHPLQSFLANQLGGMCGGGTLRMNVSFYDPN